MKLLEPCKIILDENKSDQESIDHTSSEQFLTHLVNLINAVCDQSVIEKAVDCYLSSL